MLLTLAMFLLLWHSPCNSVPFFCSLDDHNLSSVYFPQCPSIVSNVYKITRLLAANSRQNPSMITHTRYISTWNFQPHALAMESVPLDSVRVADSPYPPLSAPRPFHPTLFPCVSLASELSFACSVRIIQYKHEWEALLLAYSRHRIRHITGSLLDCYES